LRLTLACQERRRRAGITGLRPPLDSQPPALVRGGQIVAFFATHSMELSETNADVSSIAVLFCPRWRWRAGCRPD
jgi:hypothetical protein